MSFLSKSAALVIISLSLPSLGFTQPQASPEQQQLYMEMVQASQELQQLQQRAISENESLMAQRDDLVEMIEVRMTEIDSSAEVLMARRDELAEQLQGVAPAEQTEAQQNLNAELQSTMQQLQSFQQQAMQDGQIQQLQVEFQEATMAAMEEIDPAVNALISRFNDIRNELIQMQQQ